MVRRSQNVVWSCSEWQSTRNVDRITTLAVTRKTSNLKAWGTSKPNTYKTYSRTSATCQISDGKRGQFTQDSPANPVRTALFQDNKTARQHFHGKRSRPPQKTCLVGWPRLVAVVILRNHEHLVSVLQHVAVRRIDLDLAALRCHPHPARHRIGEPQQHLPESAAGQLRPVVEVELAPVETEQVLPNLRNEEAIRTEILGKFLLNTKILQSLLQKSHFRTPKPRSQF